MEKPVITLENLKLELAKTFMKLAYLSGNWFVDILKKHSKFFMQIFKRIEDICCKYTKILKVKSYLDFTNKELR